MSSSPSSPEAVPKDPLAEALERLERSMAVQPVAQQAPASHTGADPAIPDSPTARVDGNPPPAAAGTGTAPAAPVARAEPPVESLRRSDAPEWDRPPREEPPFGEQPAPLGALATPHAVPDVGFRGGSGQKRGLFWPLVLAGMVQLAAVVGLAWLLWPALKEQVLNEANAANEGPAVAVGGTTPQELKDLEAELEAIRRQVDITPGDAWEELGFLAARNRLLEAGDRAIQNGDRAAFDELLKLSTEASDERIRTGAMSEIQRVKFAYAAGIRSSNHSIPIGQLFPSLREKNELELGVDQLVKVLLDPEMRPAYRVKAAYLLADRRGVRAADALASAVATDTNLDVIRESVMTFCEMTGYRTADLLDAGALTRWWEANRSRVKAVLGG